MPSVLDMISWIAIGYGVLVTGAATFAALRWGARPPWLGSMVWMLEFLTAVRAVAGGGAILAGDRPESSMFTHVGYLITSVCILPIAMQAVGDDEEVWSVGVLAICALAVSVIGVRIVITR